VNVVEILEIPWKEFSHLERRRVPHRLKRLSRKRSRHHWSTCRKPARTASGAPVHELQLLAADVDGLNDDRETTP